MNYFKGVYKAIFNPIEPEPKVSVSKNINKVKKVIPSTLPSNRKSSPDTIYNLQSFKNNVKIVTPSFVRECIPIIRKLYKVNPDLGIALFDIIQLTNTGYEIMFDSSVSDDQADKMRLHLEDASRNWNYGTAGLPGIINKMIAQIYVSGALSNEWVPDRKLRGLEACIFVNPETIEFSLNKRETGYDPYQRVKRSFVVSNDKSPDLIKLNKKTYRYYGLFSDEDAPYGVPPFLTALEDIDSQTFMKKNIRHIVQQVGLMGFLEILVAKPNQNADESEAQYITRLNNLLSATKKNVGTGMIDGIMVGFDEDHEFDFHSTTKNMQGLSDVVSLNETQIANGLKTSGSFIGVNSGGTETMITIVFTKMLSQLNNVQNILSHNLEYGLGLELTLAGFKFKNIKVKFKPSTITDELKIQQAIELKVRNLQALYNQGIISQEEYSTRMGYEKPDQKEPRQTNDDLINKSREKEDREKKKNESDKKVREKSKSQPKRKDNKD